MNWVRMDSWDAYCAHQAGAAATLEHRRALERGLIGEGEEFTIAGYCWVCQRQVSLIVDYLWGAAVVDGVLTPNWREQLRCPECQLRNRMRATLHFLEERLAPARGTDIYVTEQSTDLFARLAERYPRAIGSEYLGREIAAGERTPAGIRNESVTRLTFADDTFDLMISLDVFEHVPEFRQALAECRRVLRPQGRLLFTVPFEPQRRDHLVRATVDASGAVRHHLPPEYHGDPLRQEGCLAFYCFGWELLEDLRRAGFWEVGAYSFWSRDFGYLGDPLLLFAATTSTGGER
jgi:SAM-dependent methyltransferase